MPTTTGVATEFISFTRASNATVTDSDGKVKWAPHNLLLNSESFDAASWARYLVATVTANAAAAPNGTTTADVVSVSASGSLYSAVSVIGGAKYKIAVWAKRNAGSNQTFVLYGGANISSDLTATADWQLFEYEFTAASTASINCGFNVGSGNAAFNVYLWGAHLYRSDLAMQPNTSAYPMYNPTTPKNLLGYSEKFDSWTNTSTTATLATGIVSPIGLSSVYKIADLDSSLSFHLTFQAVTATGRVNTLSVYAKAAEYSFVQLHASGLAGVVFNLASGSIVSGVGGSITPVGTDGWYRCSFSFTATGTQVFVSQNATSSSGYSYSGAAGSGVYVWGAQLSDSASLDSYSPVYGAAVTSAAYYGPRRDFDSAGVCKGLLVEEQRTNGLGYSNDFGNAAWAKAASGTGVLPVVTGGFTDPNGGTTAWRIQLNSGSNGSGDYSFLRQTHGLAAPFARSIWVKSNTGSTQTVTFVAPSSFRTVTIPITWTRVEQIEPGAGAAQFDISVGGTAATPATADILVWNAQAETGSFATSYIPTGAATATRNADVASVSTQAFPYSSTAGTVVANFQLLGSNLTTNLNVVALEGATGNATVHRDFSTWRYRTELANLNITGVSNSDVNKVGFAYAPSDYPISVNGGAIQTNSGSGLIGSATTLRIGNGNFFAFAKELNGHIRQITYLPRRISNTELQTRTA